MQKVTIYHNPRCTKSRLTLQLLEEKGFKPQVIEYLEDTPSAMEIKSILKALGKSPRDILRTSEDEYKANNLSDMSIPDDKIVEIMVKNPKLIERPIVVVDGKKAAIGRPPENILAII